MNPNKKPGIALCIGAENLQNRMVKKIIQRYCRNVYFPHILPGTVWVDEIADRDKLFSELYPFCGEVTQQTMAVCVFSRK